VLSVDDETRPVTVPVNVGLASGALAASAAVVGISYPEVRVNASVPDVVIGEPEIDRPVGTVIPTLVTVPVFVVYAVVSNVHVSAAVFLSRPDVPASAAIAVRSASTGWYE
jgi:hypothetical protein